MSDAGQTKRILNTNENRSQVRIFGNTPRSVFLCCRLALASIAETQKEDVRSQCFVSRGLKSNVCYFLLFTVNQS